MGLTPNALTPAQVHSYPVPTPELTLTGEPLRFTYNGSRDRRAFLQLARDRFKLCVDATVKLREEDLVDHRFAAGEQWDADVAQQRKNQGRPCPTINRVDGFLAHVVNNMRQARTAIKIQPMGDGSDEELAEIEQGLIRHIETNSQSDVADDTAFRDMCIGGLGWMRIVDDWAAPDSFDQELFVRWERDHNTVFWDPFAMQPDWSDMKYLFKVMDLTKADFIARFGKDKDAVSLKSFDAVGAEGPNWFPGGKIRVAEYFHIEEEDDTLCEMENHATQWLSKLPKGMYYSARDEDGDDMLYMRNEEGGEDHLIGRTRPGKRPTVYWALIDGVDVLKERKWKGSSIPWVPVIGQQAQIDGDLVLNGMVRFAREPQRMYNYMYASFIETVALAPRAPFIAALGQIPDGAVKDSWELMNTNPQPVLYYNPTVQDGQLVPPPQRQQASPDIGAFVAGLQMADQNLKSIFRIFDASLGQRGPQESGLAINARKIESDTGVYDWGDNLIRAKRRLGIILEELLEFYYNTPGKIINIIRDDQSVRKLVMNQPFKDEDGQTKHFDLRQRGRYAVTVSTGPSYQTRRQEAANSMMELVKVYPALLQVAGDILVSEFDWPGKDAIAARLKKTLPPGLQEPDPNAPPVPPEVQQHMQQLEQAVQQLTQLLQQATDKNQQTLMKEQFATLRTQMIQEVALATAQLKVGSDEAKYTSDKIFGELERMRASFEQMLAGVANPQTTTTAGQTAGPEPSSGGGY